MVSFMLEQNIICSQTQLDDIVHSSEQMFISRQFFAGYVVGSWPMEENFASNDKIPS